MNHLLSLSSTWYESWIDGGYVPDFLLREGVKQLSSTRLHRWQEMSVEELQREKMEFVRTIRELPVAIHTDKANERGFFHR